MFKKNKYPEIKKNKGTANTTKSLAKQILYKRIVTFWNYGE